MYLRRRPEGLYFPSILRILHSYEEYRQHLPEVLPTTHDERLREMGEGAFRWFQRHSFETIEQRATGQSDVE